MDSQKPYSIIIDGAAASGKSSVASTLSKMLKLPVYDLGKIIRLFCFILEKDGVVIEGNIDESKKKKIIEMLRKTAFSISQNGEFFINDIGYYAELDSETWGSKAACLCSSKEFLEAIEHRANEFFRGIAFIEIRAGKEEYANPNSFKIFLSSEDQERTQRRFEQGNEKTRASLEDIAERIIERDKKDVKNGTLLPLGEIRNHRVLAIKNSQVRTQNLEYHLKAIARLIQKEVRKWLANERTQEGYREYAFKQPRIKKRETVVEIERKL